MDGAFAGGLASGIRNGMGMAAAYEDYKRMREERSREEQIAEAMKGGGGPGLADAARSRGDVAPMEVQQPQMGTPGLDAALSQPGGGAVAPGGGAQAIPTVDLSGGGLASVLPGQAGAPGQQAAAPAQQRRAALAGAELDEMTDSLARGYRKALQLGDPGRAMQLLLQREKVTSQYRDDAYRGAMSQFELTGDPNALVPFINRFMPGRMEIRSVTPREETAGGQPVYMVTAFDPISGKESTQPFSYTQIKQFAGSIGDPATYRAMVVDQAKDLYGLEINKRKLQAESELRREEIRLRGDEARKTADHTATIGDRNAKPAEVSTAQWLIDNGVAKDAGEAWQLVRGARGKSRQDLVAEFTKAILSKQDDMALPKERLTPQQVSRQARELVDAIYGGGSDAAGGRQVTRTGMYEGRRVVQYDDGTIEYED